MNVEHLHGKNIAVTGATGFVGGHLVRFLRERLAGTGAIISCLIRQNSRNKAHHEDLKDLPCHEVDFHTGQGLHEALKGQNVLIHMASLLFSSSWQDYLRVNAHMAELLGAKAAQHDSMQSVLLVSSLSVTGPSATLPGVGDFDGAHPVSAYGWSKHMAEQIFLRHCGKKLVILRPPMIYGSKDKGLLPYFKAAKMGIVINPGFRRRFPVSIIHVQDVVQAIVCALKPQAQGVYHCNDGDAHTMSDIGARMALLQGKKARYLGVPLSIMGMSAACSTVLGRALATFYKHPPSWNVDKFREARQEGWLCNAKRLCDELGFVPQFSLDAGIREALTGYTQDGWL